MNNLNRISIRKNVNKLVKTYNSNDPFDICKQLNILVSYQTLDDSILGYHTKISRIPIIVINNDLSEYEAIATCAHELGHDRCHHDFNTDFLRKESLNRQVFGIEYEANCFMAELLMARADIECCQTKQQIMASATIPVWAERFVDWAYVKSNIINY